MSHQKLILMRGLPGSGKSTKAKLLAAEHDAVVVSSDEFFTDAEGRYRFDAARLPDAHGWCQNVAISALEDGKTVIVDNTNVLCVHMHPYFDAAARIGVPVEFAYPETPWRWDAIRCSAYTVHDVPLPVIQRMLDTFEGERL